MKHLKKFEQYSDDNTELDISSKRLIKFPKEYLPLPNSLKNLWCENNNLTEIPTLPNSLIELHCYKNKLTKLPTLPISLENLLCNSNYLTELPILPKSLSFLWCNDNNLTELPILPKSLKDFNFSNNKWNKPVNNEIFNKSIKYYLIGENGINKFYTEEQIEKFKSYEFQKSFMEETPFEWKDLDVDELGLHPKIKEEFDFILNYDSYKLD